MRTRILATFAGVLAATGMAGAQTRPAVTLGRPVVTLGAPVALDGVQQTSHRSTERGPVYRMAMDPLTGPAVPPPGVAPGAPGMPYAPPPPPPGGFIPAPPPPGLVAPGGACPPAHGCPNSCGPRFWVSGDYLLWWIKDGPLPGPIAPVGTPPAGINPADLQQLSAFAMAPGRSLDYGTFNGLRLTVGGWLDANNTFGLEASGFLLERRSDGGSISTTTTPLAFVPVPASATAISLSGNSRFWGLEANGLYHLSPGQMVDVQVLGGFRFLSLQENLDLRGGAVGNVFGVPFTASIADRFQTDNQFYGFQGGVKAGGHWGKLSADVTLKVALGWTHEVLNVNGQKVASLGGAVTALPGGIYAQPTNVGKYTRNDFAVVPEVGLNVGYNFTPGIRAFVGYNFLYVSNVIRPGSSMDRVINVAQLNGTLPPGPPFRPAPLLDQTDFWAHGLNFGVQFTF